MLKLKNKAQVSATYALIVSVLFTWLSFYNTDAENYLFPRIIAVALTILSVILFVSNLTTDDDKDTGNLESSYLSKILPGLIIGCLLMLVMEKLGFYSSAFLAFLAILIFYDKRAIIDVKALITKTAISSAFLLVLYLIFWHGLHVRTPTGLLF